MGRTRASVRATAALSFVAPASGRSIPIAAIFIDSRGGLSCLPSEHVWRVNRKKQRSNRKYRRPFTTTALKCYWNGKRLAPINKRPSCEGVAVPLGPHVHNFGQLLRKFDDGSAVDCHPFRRLRWGSNFGWCMNVQNVFMFLPSPKLREHKLAKFVGNRRAAEMLSRLRDKNEGTNHT